MAARLRHHAAVFHASFLHRPEPTLRSGGGQRRLDVLLEHRARDHPAELLRERQDTLADLHEGLLRIRIDDDARPLPAAAVLLGRPHDRKAAAPIDGQSARTVPGATAAHRPIDGGGTGLARRRTDGLGGRRDRPTLKTRQHRETPFRHTCEPFAYDKCKLLACIADVKYMRVICNCQY